MRDHAPRRPAQGTAAESGPLALRVRRLVRALTRNRAATRLDHSDPRLRGRTYGIPFQTVWDEAGRLADGGLPRWTLQETDDREGLIRAESRTRLLGFVDDVEIRITLDADGQTQVDLTSASRVGRADLGQNARRIRSFVRALDRSLAARKAESGATSSWPRPGRRG